MHFFAVTDTEICLPLSPCCVIPLQLCSISSPSDFPHSWAWLLWIPLHSLWTSTSVIPLFLSRSYMDMLFNTGLSHPHQILLWNLLHCELGLYLCPLCYIFSLVTDSEGCIFTCILTTQMLNSFWWGACSKPFENQNVYTSKIPPIFLYTDVSFLWFEVEISHFMQTLKGFSCMSAKGLKVVTHV